MAHNSRDPLQEAEGPRAGARTVNFGDRILPAYLCCSGGGVASTANVVNGNAGLLEDHYGHDVQARSRRPRPKETKIPPLQTRSGGVSQKHGRRGRTNAPYLEAPLDQSHP